MSGLDLQPTLIGKRVQLRPMRAEDHDALYAVASDPAIWAMHPAHDRHEPSVFRAFFADAMASGGALVVLDPAGAVIGSSRYWFGCAEPGEVEIGWTFLARAHWGGAVDAEMKRLMLRHAFGHVETVIFLVGEQNARSRRALEKIGARMTPRTHGAIMAGRHVIYAMGAADFASSPLEDLST